MTERGRDSLERDAASFAVGPSHLQWDGDSLVIRVDEIGTPLPLKLRGEIRVTPHSLPDFALDLDGAGRHRWRPIAPSADVEVAMERPSLRWRGTGYVDSNAGTDPLEQGFIAWDWSRAHDGKATAILYHGARRMDGAFGFAVAFDAAGHPRLFDPPPRSALPSTLWGVKRATRAEGGDACVLRTYEDTPFYARALIETRLLGRRMIAMHESLSLDRFASPWVQLLLPFRMPRRAL